MYVFNRPNLSSPEKISICKALLDQPESRSFLVPHFMEFYGISQDSIYRWLKAYEGHKGSGDPFQPYQSSRLSEDGITNILTAIFHSASVQNAILIKTPARNRSSKNKSKSKKDRSAVLQQANISLDGAVLLFVSYPITCTLMCMYHMLCTCTHNTLT